MYEIIAIFRSRGTYQHAERGEYRLRSFGENKQELGGTGEVYNTKI